MTPLPSKRQGFGWNQVVLTCLEEGDLAYQLQAISY
jgi:hypothetical protein